MAFLVDECAPKDFAHFIDAIGKLVATVFDMNHGVAVQHIAAIDISDSAQARAHDFMRREKAALHSSPGSWPP